MRKKIFFILALLCALLAAGSVYFYMESLAQEVKKDIEYTTILVAKDYIPARTVITTEMLEKHEVPVSQLHENTLTKKEQVIGAVSKTPFFPGEPFLEPKLASPGELKDGLSYTIAEGKRAVAIAVNEVIGVGNMVLPGDYVDVVAVLEMDQQTGEGEKRTAYSTLVAQKLRVLAVGQLMASESTSIAASTVTLEVSPAQAQQLVLATERGTIRLLLRGASDGDTTALPPFKLDDFR
ncbi:MAG: Flp pilus assembly protein CpaB [Firmicutes bacterium]|nr:Flp pilus assembly protein CpaB [Bacillota bacterium]